MNDVILNEAEVWFDETWEVAFHHDIEMVKTATDIYLTTGRIPTIHEIAGEGRPSTWVLDIQTMTKNIRFQYNHIMAARDATQKK